MPQMPPVAMNNNHRFILQPYKGKSTRFRCPGCNQREFTRYIDTETGEHLAEDVGKCNRESNCSYHYTPKQYFKEHGFNLHPSQSQFNKISAFEIPTQPSFIAPNIFKASLQHYDENNFVQYLIMLFGEEITTTLIEKYYIGTSKHWLGATVFWQVDNKGNIRTGKIMLYNSATGKRVKDNYKKYINWVHAVLSHDEFNLLQCLFGEHLLNQYPHSTVAIVESEKTAIIASAYLPGFIWLACGSLSQLSVQRLKVLKNRTVLLYPDLNGFEKWTAKATQLDGEIDGTKFIVSDLLEKNTDVIEKSHGFDIADYLIRFPLKEFNPPASEPVQYTQVSESVTNVPIVPPSDSIETSSLPEPVEGWSSQIEVLKSFFESIILPQSIKLNCYTTIEDVPKFISSHLTTAYSNQGKRYFLPYLNRLIALKNLLDTDN